MNEQKNLLLAIVASLLILLIFQYFFPGEKPSSIEDKNQNSISIWIHRKIQILILFQFNGKFIF